MSKFFLVLFVMTTSFITFSQVPPFKVASEAFSCGKAVKNKNFLYKKTFDALYNNLIVRFQDRVAVETFQAVNAPSTVYKLRVVFFDRMLKEKKYKTFKFRSLLMSVAPESPDLYVEGGLCRMIVTEYKPLMK